MAFREAGDQGTIIKILAVPQKPLTWLSYLSDINDVGALKRPSALRGSLNRPRYSWPAQRALACPLGVASSVVRNSYVLNLVAAALDVI